MKLCERRPAPPRCGHPSAVSSPRVACGSVGSLQGPRCVLGRHPAFLSSRVGDRLREALWSVGDHGICRSLSWTLCRHFSKQGN